MFQHCLKRIFYTFNLRFGDEGSWVLTGITAFLLVKLLTNYLHIVQCPVLFVRPLTWLKTRSWLKNMRHVIRYALYLIAFLGICIYLGVDVIAHDPENIQALSGIASLILGCFIFSARPSRVNWHPVFWGFLIQFLLAIITLRTEPGYRAFKWIGDLVESFVRLSDKGSNFVLGASFRATSPGFFFETAGVIVFFNACIFLLDYVGVLEFIILKIGRSLAFCLETGPIESVVAAANIFIGLSEAPLLVRPYLPAITRSELHAIMTCGFSSISGAFMAMFIKAGAPPTHMLTACLISAPAALAISKLIYPETETVDFNSQRNIRMRDETSSKTGVQAISDGATFSIKLIATIMVNMMAFVSILNLVDTLLIWCGDRAGKEDFSFNYVSSYVFYPLSWVMGIPKEDCRQASYLLGLKLLATPFVAYKDLGVLIQDSSDVQFRKDDTISSLKNRLDLEGYLTTVNGTWHYSGSDIILDATNVTLVDGVLQAKTEAILTYAMCGLSAFPAIGFTMGTFIPMSPVRKDDVVSLVVRAFIAGNLANYATGAVAGVMFNGK
ncbi:sodium/nucleoside cotransporter [Plakobranchus ocellatus]|uniref:Sodium/nucleoside cotransporter n=1 Tax=Plakobranchus ocellatus TaxID=259542 RepID=A0AAV4DV00_9GAST|nr:sodium/nucleoside cotransporter [Plakobranchus ocellatus]